jgi:hypothetical protein
MCSETFTISLGTTEKERYMWQTIKMHQKHKKTKEITIINFPLRPMKLKQVKGYIHTHMHITFFSKEICNWQLFS